MVSFWWVLVAFVGGGCAGVLVMALMCFAGGRPEQTDVRGGRSRVQHDANQWKCVRMPQQRI